MSQVVAEIIEEEIAAVFKNTSTPSYSVTIYDMRRLTNRGYTVVRNALNSLTQDGKCTRTKRWDGTYQYRFARPVEPQPVAALAGSASY